jgi:hypothetical protein
MEDQTTYEVNQSGRRFPTFGALPTRHKIVIPLWGEFSLFTPSLSSGPPDLKNLVSLRPSTRLDEGRVGW